MPDGSTDGRKVKILVECGCGKVIDWFMKEMTPLIEEEIRVQAPFEGACAEHGLHVHRAALCEEHPDGNYDNATVIADAVPKSKVIQTGLDRAAADDKAASSKVASLALHRDKLQAKVAGGGGSSGEVEEAPPSRPLTRQERRENRRAAANAGRP